MPDFKCPECGGNEFGTSNPGGDWDKAKGQCHNDSCQFEWLRSEDVKLDCFPEGLDDVLELWARMDKVASKFYCDLPETGDDWEEFCTMMNKLVIRERIVV